MDEVFQQVSNSDLFMPHGHCYLWEPALVWLQVISNALIGVAYFAISGTLAYLVHKAGDIPFKLMYLAFGVFITACGITHFFDVWVIWRPDYWLDGFARGITAIASVATAVLLPPLVPRAVAIARGAKAAHDRGQRLEEAFRDLASLYERAKELDDLKTQFFANVSHELRTPLTLILGPIEQLAADATLLPAQRAQLDVAARNAKLLLHHVNDLLDLSKLDAGRMALELLRVDVERLVRGTTANFELLARERKVSLTLETEPVRAELDREKIARVLTNLLSNALKFTPEGGRIRVALRAAGDRAVLSVFDSGPGVPAEHRALVFERFRQIDGAATRKFGGTGLGLSIARDLVELHGGTIAAGDAPEGGAAFVVELPIQAKVGGVPDEPADREHPAPPEAALVRDGVENVERELEVKPPAGRPVVLVAEDNREVAGLIASTLEARFETVRARDGAEALARAAELRPDLIITDFMMPGMSGEELLAAVRGDQRLATTPVIVLTAKMDEALRVKLLEAGAQDYLTKPFSGPELLARAGNQITLKRTRDVLQRELEGRDDSLESLAADLASSRRELRGAAESLRVARDQAMQANRVKGTFLSLVSHELRTPLTSLRLSLERLERDDALADRHRSSVEPIGRATDRLYSLIESLLEYTRVETDRLQIRRERFDVNQLVDDALVELRPRAEKKKLELTFSPREGLEGIESDPRLIRLMITNLVENAIKYTAQGRIDLWVARTDHGLEITVRDTGPGIAADQHTRIFEPFEQLEDVRNKHGAGVGLGLAITKHVVEALGGTIGLSSTPGEGSAFTIRVPLDVARAA